MKCYEFAGFALLTPAWLEALSAVAGALALFVGAYIARQIRIDRESRENFERSERDRVHTYQVLYRIRSLQEDAEITLNLLEGALAIPGPPTGVFVAALDELVARLEAFQFSGTELDVFGAERSLRLNDMLTSARRCRFMVREALAMLRGIDRLTPLDEHNAQRVRIALNTIGDLVAYITTQRNLLAEPHPP